MVLSNISTNPIELVLQTGSTRAKVLRRTGLELAIVSVFGFAWTTISVGIVAIMLVSVLNNIIPAPVPGSWIFWAILAGGYGILIFHIGRVMWTNGFQTFVFDRCQQKLIINTINLLGRKHIRTIAFSEIRDVQLYDSQKEDADPDFIVHVSLVLGDSKIMGITHPPTIILSRFNSSHKNRSQSLKLLKYHQEMCLSVRDCLGLSGFQIPKDWLIDKEIPTEAELQQKQAEEKEAAMSLLRGVFKTIFMNQKGQQNQSDLARQRTIASPHDPHAWEQLALLLACQKNPPLDEVASAYRQAARLFRENGDADQARSIDRTLQKMGR